ncbi:hypothetical protein BUALT_Bualt04G0001500 [Buddleja alternifolia]|uniref:ZF-HD dimerization-type domain-containing protein n=1 Tax=Buddleja alternifolia TaxID=168488 RepID=A0AAV6XT83_9LAMI|nr:hypothetical protein BUALT_Bualt04G0001500 [Buddleja alternifolia]
MMSLPSTEDAAGNTNNTNLMTINPKSPTLLQDNNNNKSSWSSYKLKKYSGGAIKYMECLKNHAAAIGGNATDGCGEFMPGGEDGTLEALKCSACNCHRNFHRKINMHTTTTTSNEVVKSIIGGKSSSHDVYNGPAAAAGGTEQLGLGLRHDHVEGGSAATMVVKKRHRTKFTKEQKEKMFNFAEKAGWKIQKVGESEVKGFCQETGIKRKVLKATDDSS